jgi:hypothetical protein
MTKLLTAQQAERDELAAKANYVSATEKRRKAFAEYNETLAEACGLGEGMALQIPARHFKGEYEFVLFTSVCEGKIGAAWGRVMTTKGTPHKSRRPVRFMIEEARRYEP